MRSYIPHLVDYILKIPILYYLTTSLFKQYDECLWILNHAASNHDATIKYMKSDMVLYIHSHVSYLSKPKARSCVGGHYFISSTSINPSKPPIVCPPLNGPIYFLSRILKSVMASAAKVNIGANFVNGQEALPLCVTLEELNYTQSPTPM